MRPYAVFGAGAVGSALAAYLARAGHAVVIVGRPYNTCDAGVCLDLPRTLRKLGALPIPIDCLPVREVDIADAHPDMYWRSGQDILGAARLVAADAGLDEDQLFAQDGGVSAQREPAHDRLNRRHGRLCYADPGAPRVPAPAGGPRT